MRVLKSMAMGVLVLATASCASAPPLKPAAVNVTGDWVGAWTCDYVGDGNGVVVLGLTQDGARVRWCRARDQFEIQPRVQHR